MLYYYQLNEKHRTLCNHMRFISQRCPSIKPIVLRCAKTFSEAVSKRSLQILVLLCLAILHISKGIESITKKSSNSTKLCFNFVLIHSVCANSYRWHLLNWLLSKNFRFRSLVSFETTDSRYLCTSTQQSSSKQQSHYQTFLTFPPTFCTLQSICSDSIVSRIL